MYHSGVHANGRGYARESRVLGKSLCHFQFYYEPNTALKNKVILSKQAYCIDIELRSIFEEARESIFAVNETKFFRTRFSGSKVPRPLSSHKFSLLD